MNPHSVADQDVLTDLGTEAAKDCYAKASWEPPAHEDATLNQEPKGLDDLPATDLIALAGEAAEVTRSFSHV